MRIALSAAKVTVGSSTLERVGVISRNDGTVEVRDRTGELVRTFQALDILRPTPENRWTIVTATDGDVTIERMIGGCGCGR